MKDRLNTVYSRLCPFFFLPLPSPSYAQTSNIGMGSLHESYSSSSLFMHIAVFSLYSFSNARFGLLSLCRDCIFAGCVLSLKTVFVQSDVLILKSLLII